MSAVELQLDIDEFEALLEASERPNVKAVLEKEKARLEAEIKALESKAKAASTTSSSEAAAAPEASAAAPAAPAAPVVTKRPAEPVTGTGKWVTVSDFAWDQEDKVVKVYVDLEGVGVEGSGAAVTCEFGKDRFDLQVKGLKGKDYRLNVYPLCELITAETCKYKVKKNSVVLTLKKVAFEDFGEKRWTQLKAKGNKTAAEAAQQKAARKKDPSSGIMDMMKDMYEDGDEDMKAMLNKSWSESNEKKEGGGPPSARPWQ